jgi:hypothetical protein
VKLAQRAQVKLAQKTKVKLAQRTQVKLARALARRPDLWPTALRELLIVAKPGWWRHWPPRPSPDSDYLRFRLHTAYGSGPGSPAEPEPEDVVTYLDWCRRTRRCAWREGPAR